jgi:hypothetical protein
VTGADRLVMLPSGAGQITHSNAEFSRPQPEHAVCGRQKYAIPTKLFAIMTSGGGRDAGPGSER